MEKMEENIIKKLGEIKLELIKDIKTELKRECEEVKTTVSSEINKELKIEYEKLMENSKPWKKKMRTLNQN